MESAITFFTSTVVELVVLFFMISFVVNLINAKLPANKVSQLLSGNRGYVIAVSLGALTPFCSCSTLPMTIGLIKARVSFGPMMAFLFTSPLLNPYIFVLFGFVFGIKVTAIYSVSVIVLAVISGHVLQRLHFERFIREGMQPNAVNASCEQPAPPSSAPFLHKKSLWRHSFIESYKQLAAFVPYLLIGVAVGALLHGYTPQETIEQLMRHSLIFTIPAAAILGVFLYIRASTMLPIATALIAKGASMGPVMALTVAGAGASLPELIMMKRMFCWPLMLAFILAVFTTACVTGFAIELI
ncbi:permease [Shewanella sp. Scap07]|uniref:permease n=1 Tax=Shewanella sp. Scap07 TaxID=2589987 RepID=UPI00211807E3|nr:permease [Shewanella sp. Scap07]